MTTQTRPTADTGPTDRSEPARLGSRPGRDGRRRDPWLGAGGVGFAALLLPVVLIPHPGLDLPADRPVTDPGAMVAFFRAHQLLETYQATMHTLAALALLVFLTGLAGRVRDVEPGSRVPGLTRAAGGLAAAVMVITMAVVTGTITHTGAVDGGTQFWLYDLGWSVHVQALYGVGLALLPACWLLLRRRGLPAALAVTGLAVGAIALLAMLAPVLAGALGGSVAAGSAVAYPALFAVILWLAVTGVVAVSRGFGPPRR